MFIPWPFSRKVNSHQILKLNFIARMFSHDSFHVTTGNTAGLIETSTKESPGETQQVHDQRLRGKA